MKNRYQLNSAVGMQCIGRQQDGQYKLPSGKCHMAQNSAMENILKPPEFEIDPGRSLLSKGYCVTFDKNTNLTYLGLCPNTKV